MCHRVAGAGGVAVRFDVNNRRLVQKISSSFWCGPLFNANRTQVAKTLIALDSSVSPACVKQWESGVLPAQIEDRSSYEQEVMIRSCKS